jgi:hypothetical protein
MEGLEILGPRAQNLTVEALGFTEPPLLMEFERQFDPLRQVRALPREPPI